MPPKKKSSATTKRAAANPPSETENSPPPAKKQATTKKKKTNTETDDVDKDSAVSSGAQFSKTQDLVVPLDEGCTLSSSYKVYIDNDNGIIYDASLNQTNAGNNNNKFYRIQLLNNGHDFYTWTRWGRVGEIGQSAVLGDGSFDGALRDFNKKFKDKTGLKWEDRNDNAKPKKYVFVERSYESDPDDDDDDVNEAQEAPPKNSTNGDSTSSQAPEVKCTLSEPVQDLMKLIFNAQYMDATMLDLNYDANKMPLGKLSRVTITRGYEALRTLSDMIDDPQLATAASDEQESYGDAVQRLSNTYYSYIPHDFGRNRPPVISSQERLRKEIDLLDSLTDMKIADSLLRTEKTKEDSVHFLDARFNGLKLNEMTPLEKDTDEFNHIKRYLMDTTANTHHVRYDLLDVFRISRQGEQERFKTFKSPTSDRRLLWHGSRSTNYGGILSEGLRIAPPHVPAQGFMFGRGIYLADMSSKSSNYCFSYNSAGEGLLLLCEAELGDMLELRDASYTAGEDAVAKNCQSTWGQGGTGPQGWKDAKCIHPSLASVKMPDTTKAPGATDTGKDGGFSLLYNEYITYDVAQVCLRYLLRVKM